MKKENVILGSVGALLGAVVGGIAIIIFAQFGYVAAISGVIMALAALKGYELLGGRLSVKGVVIAAVLMIGITFVSHSLGLAISVASEIDAGFFEIWKALPQLLEISDAVGDYWVELAMLYAFTLIGAVPITVRSLRSARAAGQQPAPFTGSISIPQQTPYTGTEEAAQQTVSVSQTTDES